LFGRNGIRLWDDSAEYDRISRAARERPQQWHPDLLAPLYCYFFSHAGLGFVPSEAAQSL
jgi:hypothetical protein